MPQGPTDSLQEALLNFRVAEGTRVDDDAPLVDKVTCAVTAFVHGATLVPAGIESAIRIVCGCSADLDNRKVVSSDGVEVRMSIIHFAACHRKQLTDGNNDVTEWMNWLPPSSDQPTVQEIAMPAAA